METVGPMRRQFGRGAGSSLALRPSGPWLTSRDNMAWAPETRLITPAISGFAPVPAAVMKSDLRGRFPEGKSVLSDSAKR